MEELLNKLIEKGWKPRNVISKNIYIYKVEDKINLSYSEFLEDEWEVMHEDEWYSLRDLVSKWSWLWQYVCENGMVKEDDGHITRIINLYKSDETIVDGWWNYHYWLMICSILDESELEQFLLDNIKVE